MFIFGDAATKMAFLPKSPQVINFPQLQAIPQQSTGWNIHPLKICVRIQRDSMLQIIMYDLISSLEFRNQSKSSKTMVDS